MLFIEPAAFAEAVGCVGAPESANKITVIAYQ